MSDWNERQREAIEARGSVVVSAAAGSGKTSVLAERVLRLIEEGEDIEGMLIVTFTNLAASEMKEKIFRRLQEAKSPRLAAQAEKCAFADISTIHSFCGRIIRDNFEHAGVSPDYSVADDALIGVLKNRAMDDILEEAARDESLRGFFGRFSPKGDLKYVRETVFKIYDRIISLKSPDGWLNAAEENLGSERFIAALFGEYVKMVQEASAKAAACLSERTQIWELGGFPEEAALSGRELLGLKRTVERLDISDVRLPRAEHISSAIKRAPNGKSATHTNRANKCFEELLGYEGDFAGKVRAELAAEKEDALAFIRLARSFREKYEALKRAKGLIDHDDLLHLALKALNVPGIAKRYKDKYSHVFVDEYQDINEIQDSILKLLMRGANDFLVGDVKQCIYMFRESNPSLLIGRCEELRGGGLIEMNMNYRSEPEVIKFINSIMERMMDPDAGGVNYSGGQALVCAKNGEGSAKIILAGDKPDKSSAEAAAIAAHIKELKAQGFGYGDIAVLRPEMATSGMRLLRALRQAGIPVSGPQEADLKFGETAVFLNLLSVIDNPTDDVALASVMRFPHFKFTEPDLARIRIKAGAEAAFCDAVLGFCEDSELGARVSAFLKEIERYRALSRAMKLPDFLQRLRLETGFSKYALTSPAGGAGDEGIAAFIGAVAASGAADIRDALELAQRPKDSKQQGRGEADAVFLTTIHKSKGLEFPAVILSGMHKKINQRDSYGNVLVGRALGLAVGVTDGETRVRKPTLHLKAVERAMRAETVSESVRLIYVGMTRAISSLAIVGAGSELKEKWTREKLPGWQHEANTYFDLIIGAASLTGRDINELVEFADAPPQNEQSAGKAEKLGYLFEAAQKARPCEMFEKYEYERDLGVPSKVSVTALKKRGRQALFPAAMEQEGPSAAQKGTLTHRVLQKMGVAQRSAAEIKEFIKRMESEGEIEPGSGDYADAGQIEGFLNSETAKRARSSERILFEAPFCLEVPANEAGLSDSGETVIVQGVVDMCFVEDGKWVIVDYKTDSVDAQNAAKAAAERYSVQLSMYARALEEITRIGVKEKIVYFLSAGCAVRIE